MKIDKLYSIICSRRTNPIAGSYTTHLFNSGEDEIIKKVGEETVEVLLAAKGQSKARLIEEISDLTYHVLVLMAAYNVTPDHVREELEKRHH